MSDLSAASTARTPMQQLGDSLASVPITTDLFRARAVLDQRKADHHLTVAEVNELERIVRDGIDLLLSRHARMPLWTGILGILDSINVDAEMDGDRIEVRCESVEELMNLGSLFAQHAPREQRWLIEQATWEQKTGVVWWPVPREELEAA